MHLEDSASFPLVLPSDDIVYMFLLWGIEDFHVSTMAGLALNAFCLVHICSQLTRAEGG